MTYPYYRPPGGDPFAGPPQAISPDSYHGFLPYMDLRSRGRLSDEVVMKVRSEEAVPYRGVVFDDYNGKGWEISTGDNAEKLDLGQPALRHVHSRERRAGAGAGQGGRPGLPRREGLLQHHLRRLPPRDGLLPDEHHRDRPLRLPAERRTRSPRAPRTRSSPSVPNASPAQLRSAGTVYPEEIADKYTQLPPTGLERTRALAARLTEDTTNPYDAVLRMNEYLKTTYPYDLSIPPQGEDMDAVEYFLFEQKRGYCEQFSSSLAVMARSLGIPARVATGYAPASTTRSPASTTSAPPTPTPGSRSTSRSTAGPPSTPPRASTLRPGSTRRPATCRAARPSPSWPRGSARPRDP